MPRIFLQTHIAAKKEVVFDLARSIDLHKISTGNTNEKAVAGKTSGLIELGETVTWKAKHLGIYQKLTSRITAFERPNHFTDEMLSGPFKTLRHDHQFSDVDGAKTIMTDIFEYRSPLGPIGRLADWLFLKNYLKGFLKKRNAIIKEFAESDKWQLVLT